MDVIRGFFLVELLSTYGLMLNIAETLFIGCSFFVWSLVFERIQIRV